MLAVGVDVPVARIIEFGRSKNASARVSALDKDLPEPKSGAMAAKLYGASDHMSLKKTLS